MDFCETVKNENRCNASDENFYDTIRLNFFDNFDAIN